MHVTTTDRDVAGSAVSSRALFRSLAIVAVVISPAAVLRVLAVQPTPILGLITY
ncbi:MAG: hypothetical protein QOD02_2322, partial [Mycobacterium sp.]|nr:hypothetical protein [Mycobacterium sp.]